MISSNNSDLDVDALMQRVREEVAAMRAFSMTHQSVLAMEAAQGRLPPVVVDLSRHAVVSELIEDAARMSKPRTAIPRRLERPPFSALRPLVSFGLRVLNYTQKDQRHVNAATQQALREALRLSVMIGNSLTQFAEILSELRNAPRDLAALVARLTVFEGRQEALDARVGGLDASVLERIGTVENALGALAQRIEGIAAGALPARIGALEEAMTVNARRIDTLEHGPIDARLLALETANTIAAARLERLEALREEAQRLVALVDEAQRDVARERERALRSEAGLRMQLTAQLSAAAALAPHAPASAEPAASAAGPPSERSYEELHLAIADRFRGDTATAALALEHYVAVVRDAAVVDAAHPLIDIGCGRGEWLAALAAAGLPAFGVELSAMLVARGQEEGLDIRPGDGLTALRALPAGSLGAITAFHVIEHVPFGQLVDIVDESLRVLRPGGLLVFETPNPANVTIGACNFYLDPTHRHPLPSLLVALLIELRGFAEIRTVELAPNDAMRVPEETETARRFNDFFYGPQNYAVIARAPGTADLNSRVAIVCPWFGADSHGGAETLAAELAKRLTARYDVDFLTTTSRSFLSDWGHDHFAPGRTRGAFDVVRFRLDDRSPQHFDELNAALLAMPAAELRMRAARLDLASQATFLAENINSSELVDYIEAERRKYKAIVFVPYLYGTTLRGIEAAGDRAYLQPCLHNEIYAYLRPVERAIHHARGLLFNSRGEFELALRLYGPGILHKSHIVGSGVEVLAAPESKAALPEGIRSGEFLLYLGRRDATKGVDGLLDAFARARTQLNGIKLVLAGPGKRSYADPANAVIDLGYVSDSVRAALLARSIALVQPSPNESFSRAMMESWAYRRPVIVNGNCEAMRAAVDDAGGGWTASTPQEWTQAIVEVVRAPREARDAAAGRGRAYAGKTADWDAVVARYADIFEGGAPRVAGARKTVHQVLETLEYGDAISNHAIVLRDRMRARGFRSDILVRTVGTRVLDEVRIFDEQTLKRADAVVYHHSMGSSMTAAVIAARKPTALIYHNITPGHFFAKYRPELAHNLEVGRAQLADLRETFAVSLGDSQFNADELVTFGFRNVGVLPICMDLRRFDVEPDPAVMKFLADGRQNILFVGRIAPNKAHAELIDVLARLRAARSNVRLILAGRYDGNEGYYAELRALVAALGVEHDVIFTGLISDAELLAYYRSAQLFLSLSDHEGFCVPLIEAMWFEIPVIAYGSAASGETMGYAGIVLDDKSDRDAIAALVRIAIGDAGLRHSLIVSQARRREDFRLAATLGVFDGIVDGLLSKVRA